MKKILVGIIILMLIVTILINDNSKLIINEGISLRVIANSNSVYDQQMKLKVKEKVQSDIYSILNNTNNINEARNIISANLQYLNNNLKKYLSDQKYNINYTFDFGQYYYSGKEYKGIKYNEGYYESVLIKLGKGEGDNWWCILFPPLCLLEAEESSEVEYKFFVQELINRYLIKH
ncbi:MAG: stage II sporulation protein R [Bacilli bacterium]|nr:stage II sporulation protein R [Bacilli bacterium]